MTSGPIKAKAIDKLQVQLAVTTRFAGDNFIKRKRKRSRPRGIPYLSGISVVASLLKPTHSWVVNEPWLLGALHLRERAKTLSGPIIRLTETYPPNLFHIVVFVCNPMPNACSENFTKMLLEIAHCRFFATTMVLSQRLPSPWGQFSCPLRPSLSNCSFFVTTCWHNVCSYVKIYCSCFYALMAKVTSNLNSFLPPSTFSLHHPENSHVCDEYVPNQSYHHSF